MGVGKVAAQTLSDFGKETSIAGINNFARAKSNLRKAYWLVVFAVLSYYTVDGLVRVIVDFSKHPVITSINLDHKASVNFPAITVCNLNRIHCNSVFTTLVSYRKKLREIQKESGKDSAAYNATKAVRENLKNIFKQTLCNVQLCSAIDSAVPPVRESASDNDDLVIMQESLE